MIAFDIDLELVMHYYRILGCSVGASKDELRRARNKLLLRFHPDKHVKAWIIDELTLESRVHFVQEAFLFLTKHHKEIHNALKGLEEIVLTSQTSTRLKSHWVYSEILKIKD